MNKMEETNYENFWTDSFNSSWTREDLSLLLSSGGTQFLFEKLVNNGESKGCLSFFQKSATKPTRKASRWKIYDSHENQKSNLNQNLMPNNLTCDGGFHFKDFVDVSDFESMISGLLELQIKLGRQLLNQSDLVILIHQKVAIFNRLAHAYRVIHQKKVGSKSPLRETSQENAKVI